MCTRVRNPFRNAAAPPCNPLPAVDAGFYAAALRRYSGTHAYTGAILGYVFGAGTLMTVAAPNFGGLFKRQQALEGACPCWAAQGEVVSWVVGSQGRGVAGQRCSGDDRQAHRLRGVCLKSWQRCLSCRRVPPPPHAAASQCRERGFLWRHRQGGSVCDRCTFGVGWESGGMRWSMGCD